MTAHNYERWSKADIAELARFIVKRHGTEAAAFAQARAAMFHAASEWEDATRWSTVAERLRSAAAGNVVALRRPAPKVHEVPAAAPPVPDRQAAGDDGRTGAPAAPLTALRSERDLEAAATRLTEQLNRADTRIAGLQQQIAQQQAMIDAAESAGGDTRSAVRRLETLRGTVAFWREAADRVRRALDAQRHDAALIRRATAALMESRTLLGWPADPAVPPADTTVEVARRA